MRARAGDAASAPMTDRLPILYQAEWCPFSSAVREILTELGIDAVIRQVEPDPEQRAHLREATGTDEIPVLVAEDGQVYRGTREIFVHLRERGAWRFAAAHRREYANHREARESGATERLIERFRSAAELEPAKP
jgi:glutathione S-transferase